MSIVTSQEMFAKAYAGGYAIGAFNVNNMEIIQGITEAAKECNAPVILQVSSGARKYANRTYLVKLVEAAVIETGLPICLHLDHGDSFELCKACVDDGFSSVMIDASSKPFEENVALTRQVVEYAHAHGAVVEAELGTLAGIEDDVKVKAEDSSYTRPEDVQEFVERTGCTSLAIGVGTAHGVYTEEPHIDQDVVKAIRAAVDVPLVLHGTSGVPDEQVAEAVKNGICKVNYATELRQAYTKGYMAYMAENPNNFDPKNPGKAGAEEITKIVKIRMENLGSVGRA